MAFVMFQGFLFSVPLREGATWRIMGLGLLIGLGLGV